MEKREFWEHIKHYFLRNCWRSGLNEFHCSRISTNNFGIILEVHELVVWFESFGFERLLLYEKAVGKMGVAFACNRVTTSQKSSALFNCNPNKFLRHFITVNKTYIHHYTSTIFSGFSPYGLFPIFKT